MKNFILLLTLSLSTIGFAQKDLSHVVLDELVTETQISVGNQDELGLVWIIPVEFWIVSFIGDSSMTEMQRNSIIETLEPYYIVAVADGDLGMFGGVTYTPEEEIRESLEVTIDGSVHSPLKESYLSADMRIMLASFKPILGSMLGAMGENMHFFVFNDRNAKDKRILNPYEFGQTMEITYLDKAAILKMPIGSLLKKKKCPVDNEEYNGGWKYCPYHGEELKK